MLYTDFRDGNFIERENELTKVHKDYFLLTAIFFSGIIFLILYTLYRDIITSKTIASKRHLLEILEGGKTLTLINIFLC